MKQLISRTLFVTVFVGVSCVIRNGAASDSSGELALEQSLPVLRVLSKVQPIVPVRSHLLGPYKPLPHFCWITANRVGKNAFAPVARILEDVETQSRWFMSYEVPYFCIFAQPKEESDHSLGAWPRNPHSMSLTAIISARDLAIKEIPSLSNFIEEHLHLHDKPTLGLEPTAKDLTLPGLADYEGPHSKNFFLVADPISFSPYHGTLTSDYDRMLHYGLTDEEAFALESAVQADRSFVYTIVPKFFYEPYRDARILPDEIRKLQAECKNLKTRTSDNNAIRALEKLLSIGDSAQRYNLGIYLDSD